MKAQELIIQALRLLGTLRVGQTPSADVLAEGLSMLNGMLDAWTVERLMVPTVARRELALVPLQQTYTIGAGGDWDVERPVRIERMGAEVDGSGEVPVTVIGVEQWADLQLKSATGTFPQVAYYETTYPLGRVHVWPVPTVSGTAVLYCWAPVAQFADLNTTDYDFPPGYLLCLRFNLAGWLMPAYTIQNKSQQGQWNLMIERAEERKAWVKMVNAPAPRLEIDAALQGGQGWSVLTGGC